MISASDHLSQIWGLAESSGWWAGTWGEAWPGLLKQGQWAQAWTREALKSPSLEANSEMDFEMPSGNSRKVTLWIWGLVHRPRCRCLKRGRARVTAGGSPKDVALWTVCWGFWRLSDKLWKLLNSKAFWARVHDQFSVWERPLRQELNGKIRLWAEITGGCSNLEETNLKVTKKHNWWATG